MVEVGRGVLVGIGVTLGYGVLVAVCVAVFVMLGVGDWLGSGVGGVPSTRNLPDTIHFVPTNIWTSYSPSIHSDGSGSQSVNPNPPDPPSQGNDS